MAQTLKQQAVHGVMWSAIETFSTQGIVLVLALIIARFVTPEEYGLVAMLTIFTSVASAFIGSGFGAALVQKRGGATQTDCSTVFYFNIVVAVAMYLLLYLCAPYIAQFYHEPLLTTVLRWEALSLIIGGLTVVQGARLNIAMDFKTSAKASLISVAVGGGVGVWMAYHGYGVWALVARTLIASSLRSLLLWVFSKWRPSWEFSKESFRTLFGFGSKLLASNLMNTIYGNLYSLVIGRFYSATDVGYYRNANGITSTPMTNTIGVITRVAYPMQCRMQDDDELLSRLFLQYMRISYYIMVPCMVGLAVIAEPFVEFVLTEKWLPSAKLVSILCLSCIWVPVNALNLQILNVKGRSDYTLQVNMIMKIVAIATLVCMLPFGVEALCWGNVFCNTFNLIITIFYSRKVISTGYWRQAIAIAPIFMLNVAMAGCVWFSVNYLFDALWLKVLGGVAVGVVSYVTLSYIFRFKEIDNIKSLLTELKR